MHIYIYLCIYMYICMYLCTAAYSVKGWPLEGALEQ